MSFAYDSRPPIAPVAGAAVYGGDLELVAADGSPFAAYHATASAPSGHGVLILPDVRGLSPFNEELALRFAETSIDALAIDYFGRTAGVGKREEGFEHAAHVAQTTWDGLRADTLEGAAWLRSERKVRTLFVLGFCFGGRLAFLSGAEAHLAATGVIGFYGVPVGRYATTSRLPSRSFTRCAARCWGSSVARLSRRGASRWAVDPGRWQGTRPPAEHRSRSAFSPHRQDRLRTRTICRGADHPVGEAKREPPGSGRGRCCRTWRCVGSRSA